MHMGQGSSPTTCCRYSPKASMPTQAALTSARIRRGAVSNHWIKIFPHLFHKHTGAARRHHQRLALAESHILVLLRRNLRLDDGILIVSRWFGVVRGNKFQPGDGADDDRAA